MKNAFNKKNLIFSSIGIATLFAAFLLTYHFYKPYFSDKAATLLGCKHLFNEEYVESAKWYKVAAHRNNPHAQNALSGLYAQGNGVDKDEDKAFQLALKAAEKGHILAQRKIASYYQHGIGVSRNFAKAVEWYKKSADQGDRISEYMLAHAYYDGHLGLEKNHIKSFEYALRSSDSQMPMASVLLANMYMNGHGVRQSYDNSVRVLESIRDLRYPPAQTILATLYKDGLGVPRNIQQYSDLLHEAAENNFPLAQSYLAKAYLSGDFGERDQESGIKWAKRAAEQGDPNGQVLVAIYHGGKVGKENEKEAYFWLLLSTGQKGATREFEIVAKTLLPELESSLSNAERQEVQERARNWEPSLLYKEWSTPINCDDN